MVALDLASWAAIVGTWALVVGTLSFAYWQLRQAQRLHSASTLLDLRERFFNPRMLRARREFSAWLLGGPRAGEETENWEVAIFFEQLGFLTRSGVLDKRMVWNAFGTWATAYHFFLTHPVDRIELWRRESRDPLLLREFERLAAAMLAHESRLVRGLDHTPYSESDARFVLEVESRLRGSDADGLP